jgi:hypothetical protein
MTDPATQDRLVPGPEVSINDNLPTSRMTPFNYGIVAELFPTRNDVERFPVKSRRARRPPLGYGRFVCAAYAIRFAIEELPADRLTATCLEVDEQIFDCDGIRRLYDSKDYPLVRRVSPLRTANFKHHFQSIGGRQPPLGTRNEGKSKCLPRK